MQHVMDSDSSRQRAVLLWPFYVGLLALSVLGGGLLSCSGDTTGLPAQPTVQAYWALRLNRHAVNLALTPPHDTVRLSAIPLTVTGTPLSGVPAVTFQAHDSSVTVDSTGLVTARFTTPPGQATFVTAALTLQGVSLSDTVFIQVTATVPPALLATFSMQPAPGDSAKRSIDSVSFNWPVTATDAVHDTLCNRNSCALQVDYASSNPLVATIDRQTGTVFAIKPGRVVFTATTLAYGVTKQDSVVFTIGNILSYMNSISAASIEGRTGVTFSAPQTLIVGVGAVVRFWNITSHPVDVVFDDTMGVDSTSFPGLLVNTLPPTGSGDIAAFGGDTTCPSSIVTALGGCTEALGSATYVEFNNDNLAARRFRRPGIYHYHSTLFPSTTFSLIIN